MNRKLSCLCGVGILAFGVSMGAASADEAEFDPKVGKTGGYFAISGMYGSFDDISANYLSGDTVKESYSLDEGYGGQIQAGHDFGIPRVDWRLGALRTTVDSVGTANTSNNDDAVLAYSTINLAFDVHRFPIKGGTGDMAVTPYIGAGIGVGGGWTNAVKSTDIPGANADQDKADAGLVVSGEVGVLFDVTPTIGVTAGYNYIRADFSEVEMDNHLASAGFRFTF